MLKISVMILLLANVGFGLWNHFSTARSPGEPERLARQVRPQLVQVLSPAADTASAASSAPAPLVCLEAGPFNTPAEVSAAQEALKVALPKTPASQWTEVKTDTPGVWMVYIGPFADVPAQEKKTQELMRRGISFDTVTDQPSLSPGFSLGRFGLRASANQALEDFRKQGVRTARVIEITPPVTQYFLRASNIRRELARQLKAVESSALKAGFDACVAGVI